MKIMSLAEKRTQISVYINFDSNYYTEHKLTLKINNVHYFYTTHFHFGSQSA